MFILIAFQVNYTGSDSRVMRATNSLWVIRRFYLYCRMENAVFILFTDFVDIVDGFLTPRGSHMACEYIFSSCKGPAVEIVNFFNGIEFENVVIELFSINVARRCLHDNFDAVWENGDSGEEHKDWEEVGAHWVGDLPFWF